MDGACRYGFHKEPAGGKDPEGAKKERLLQIFGHWTDMVTDLIKATPEKDVLRRDIFDRAPILKWTSGRVALLGDSAHAMQPNLGQGGCMAIEDGYQLAKDLGEACKLSQDMGTPFHPGVTLQVGPGMQTCIAHDDTHSQQDWTVQLKERDQHLHMLSGLWMKDLHSAYIPSSSYSLADADRACGTCQGYQRKRVLRASTIHGLAGMAAIMASTYKAYLGEGLGPLSWIQRFKIPHPGRVRVFDDDMSLPVLVNYTSQ